MSHLLLISPSFHGYWKSIADAFVRRGHQVTPFQYDEFPSTRDKVRNKLRYELPDRLGRSGHQELMREFTERAIPVLRESSADVVVVIKGDQLNDDFWQALAATGKPHVTWFYDELRRMHHHDDRLASMGPIASYSALDTAELVSRGIQARHLHLAFDHTLTEIDPRTRNDDVVFIGARYPKREADLVALAAAGISVRAFGRDWSHHPVDRARTWSWRRPDIPHGPTLTRAEAYAEQAAALATLNTHGDQDGFTMRTFEVCGVGGVELVDRPDVAELYQPGEEILVFRSEEELIELATRLTREPETGERIRAAGRRRTLAEHTFDHRVAVLEELWG